MNGDVTVALYEMRTYTLYVGKMAEAVRLYQEFGFPALQKGGHDKHLVGYFQSDTGTINQLVHLWKFDDDALGRGVRECGFRGRICRKIPPAGDDRGGEAAASRAVGPTLCSQLTGGNHARPHHRHDRCHPAGSESTLLVIEGEISPPFVVEFAQAHEAAGFDMALVGYSSSSAEGFLVAMHAAARTERMSYLSRIGRASSHPPCSPARSRPSTS